MKRIRLTLFLLLAVFPALLGIGGDADAVDQLPVKGTVTMVDLGSPHCLPCRLMAPILDELMDEYKGRAAIVYLDVWEAPALASQYGIRAIPTQIFYDKQGREVLRHEGFLSKENIVLVLSKLGVAKPEVKIERK